jgi:hypothetical protein
MLNELLQANRAYKPTYGRNHLCNHMSMTLIALSKLGAENERLLEYFYKNKQKLVPVSAVTEEIKIDDNSWIKYLGNSQAYENYYLFFSKTIEVKGIDSTLKQYLPYLIKGFFSQAFHCAIRLAYSIEIKDKAEIACSLAYFASEYTSFNYQPQIKIKKVGLCDFLAKLRGIDLASYSGELKTNITDRLHDIGRDPAFQKLMCDKESIDLQLYQCAQLVVKIHTEVDNFISLHMVTATYALRILFPFIQNKEEALKHYWYAICAAYVAIGMPKINNNEQYAVDDEEQTNWFPFLKKITYSDDEHAIKLAYTCYQEFEKNDYPRYFKIVKKLVQKIYD